MESKGETTTENVGKNLLLVPAIVLVLSLATWLFFHIESMPLTAPETTVVAGGWFVVVFLCRLFWQRVHPKKTVNR
jgi:hypothetical protein